MMMCYPKLAVYTVWTRLSLSKRNTLMAYTVSTADVAFILTQTLNVVVFVQIFSPWENHASVPVLSLNCGLSNINQFRTVSTLISNKCTNSRQNMK